MAAMFLMVITDSDRAREPLTMQCDIVMQVGRGAACARGLNGVHAALAARDVIGSSKTHFPGALQRAV